MTELADIVSTHEPEAAPTAHGLTAAATALSNRNHTRVGKTLGWVMLGQSAYQTGRAWWKKKNAEKDYTVAVPADDDIYGELHEWLLHRLTPTDRRALLARSSRRIRNDQPVAASEAEPKASLRLFYDGRQSQTIVVDGHEITVALDDPGSGTAQDIDFARWLRKERLVFTCHGEPSRDALVVVLEELVANLAVTREPRVFIARRWGGWDVIEDVPARSLDSVVLRDGEKERLVADLDFFLAAEAEYVKLGIPYHRSYLLFGTPGTGKSSLTKALARHFGLDLRYLPLSIMENDQALLECLSNVGSRSVLLIEDIDIAHAARERDDTQHGVTLSGLLNGLDGVVTPWGLITCMTTNNVAVLDDALIRPGRVDLSIELGHVDDRQLSELVAVMGAPMDLPPLNGRLITPAEVVGVLKRNIGDPIQAEQELHALILGGCDAPRSAPIAVRED